LFNTKIKAPLIAVFKQGLTPEALALSFAFGISGGLFPVPGITSLACFVFIYFFSLNLAATQIVNFLMTPIDVACVIPFIKIGNWIFGVDEDVSTIFAMFDESIVKALGVAGTSILRGIVAWLIVMPFITIAAYYLLVPLTRRAMPPKDK